MDLIRFERRRLEADGTDDSSRFVVPGPGSMPSPGTGPISLR